MRYSKTLLASSALCAVFVSSGYAQEITTLGTIPTVPVIAPTSPDLVIELGAGIGAVPAYEGASSYTGTFLPLINLERLNIPGLIDIGGDRPQAGLKIAPSVSFAPERKSADHAALAGLNDVDATFGIGVRAGYEFSLNEMVSAQPYVAARYAFGGATGFVGEVGLDMTARLTPELTLVAGPVVSLAGENYMDRYYGVSAAESAATGGRLGEYDANGGIKSVGVKAAVKYEFVPDTFVNLEGSYARAVGSAENSPIVQSGSGHAFTAGIGISRRFSVNY